MFPHRLTDKSAFDIAQALVDSFNRHYRLFRETTAQAKQRFERNYLVQLLKLTEGNVADAARIADRNRTEFYRLLQKYDLTPGMFRSNVNPAPD